VKKAMMSKSINGVEIAENHFYNVLKEHNIELDNKAIKYIKEKLSANKDTINLKEALASITVNLNLNDPIKGKWGLRSNKQI